MRLHIVLKEGFRTPEAAAKVVAAAKLTNVNESRLAFFKYSILTATSNDVETLSILGELDEVAAVEIDGKKIATSP